MMITRSHANLAKRVAHNLLFWVLLFGNNMALIVEAQRPCESWQTQQECEDPPVNNSGDDNNSSSSNKPPKEANCAWCRATETCVIFTADIDPCPTDNIFGHPCTSLDSQQNCTAAENCLWCDETAVCKSQAQGCRGQQQPQQQVPPDNNAADRCNQVTLQEDCDANKECTWCGNDSGGSTDGNSKVSCWVTEKGCPGGNINNEDNPNQPNVLLCNQLTDQDNCTAADDNACIWCTDKETCGDADKGCPGESPLNGSDKNANCHRLSTESNCTETDNCVWCQDDKKCQDKEKGGCGDNPDNNGNCNHHSNQTDCEELEACQWCGNRNVCRAADRTCPGGNDGTGNPDIDTSLNCHRLADQTECIELDTCQWCDNQAICRASDKPCPGNNGQVPGNNTDGIRSCPSIRKAEECLEASSCFWCSRSSKCRQNFASCPGNENLPLRGKVCAPIRNETDCTATVLADDRTCVWCDDKSLCRAAAEECPGRGRGNPCMLYDTPGTCPNVTTDEAGVTCRWHSSAQKCLPARGVGNTTRDDKPSELSCPLFSSMDNCTATSKCRWCPDQEQCRKASQSCPGGGTGQRGNPCARHDSQASCSETEGCLWCEARSKCKKASHSDVCDNDDDEGSEDGSSGNTTRVRLCKFQDAEPDCNDIQACQWCEAQGRCRTAQANCTQPSRDVEIDLLLNMDTDDDDDDDVGLGGRGRLFRVQDNGLGSTDSNAVSVGLAYLYEVNNAGETIGSSLVDLALQDYTVKQTVGQFYDESIKARKITFEAEIESVGLIMVDTYIFMESGTISTQTGETWTVVEGDFKFDAILSNWIYCGDGDSTCGDGDETSAYIDLAFQITGGTNTPESNQDNRLLFGLGGNVPLLLSAQVEVDGSVQEMPSGFPRLESSTNQEAVFAFRFPRFDSRIVYDPFVPYHEAATFTDPTDESTEDDAQIGTTAPTGSVLTTTSPTGSPTPFHDSGPSNRGAPASNSSDDDGVPIFAIIGFVVGGLMFCCACFFVAILRRRRHGAGFANKYPDEKDTPIMEEAPQQARWDDEGIIQPDPESPEELNGGYDDSGRMDYNHDDEDDESGSYDEDDSGSSSGSDDIGFN